MSELKVSPSGLLAVWRGDADLPFRDDTLVPFQSSLFSTDSLSHRNTDRRASGSQGLDN